MASCQLVHHSRGSHGSTRCGSSCQVLHAHLRPCPGLYSMWLSVAPRLRVALGGGCWWVLARQLRLLSTSPLLVLLSSHTDVTGRLPSISSDLWVPWMVSLRCHDLFDASSRRKLDSSAAMPMLSETPQAFLWPSVFPGRPCIASTSASIPPTAAISG